MSWAVSVKRNSESKQPKLQSKHSYSAVRGNEGNARYTSTMPASFSAQRFALTPVQSPSKRHRRRTSPAAHAKEGYDVGTAVGSVVGSGVGAGDGRDVGRALGRAVGVVVGREVGAGEGGVVGVADGSRVGSAVGA